MEDWQPVPLVEGSEECPSSDSLMHLAEHFAGINVSKISSSSNNTSELLRPRIYKEPNPPSSGHRGKEGGSVPSFTSTSYSATRDTLTPISGSVLETATKMTNTSHFTSPNSAGTTTLYSTSALNTNTTSSDLPASQIRTANGLNKTSVLTTFTTDVSSPPASSTWRSTVQMSKSSLFASTLTAPKDQTETNPPDLSVGELSDSSQNPIPHHEDSLDSVAEPVLSEYQSRTLLREAREKVLNDKRKIASSMGYKVRDGKHSSTKHADKGLSTVHPVAPHSKPTEGTASLTNGLEQEVHLIKHKNKERLFALKEEDPDSTLLSYREPSTESYTTVSVTHDNNTEGTSDSTQDVIERLATEAFKRDRANPCQVVPGSDLDNLDQLWQAFLRSPYAKLTPNYPGQSLPPDDTENRLDLDRNVLNQLCHLQLKDDRDVTDVRCTCDCRQKMLEKSEPNAFVKRKVRSTGALRSKLVHSSSSSTDSSPTLRDARPVLLQSTTVGEKRSKSEKVSRHALNNARNRGVQTSPILMQAAILNQKKDHLQPYYEEHVGCPVPAKPLSFVVPTTPPGEDDSITTSSTLSSASDLGSQHVPATSLSRNRTPTLQEACWTHKQEFIRNCQHRQKMLREFKMHSKQEAVHIPPALSRTFRTTVPSSSRTFRTTVPSSSQTYRTTVPSSSRTFRATVPSSSQTHRTTVPSSHDHGYHVLCVSPEPQNLTNVQWKRPTYSVQKEKHKRFALTLCTHMYATCLVRFNYVESSLV